MFDTMAQANGAGWPRPRSATPVLVIFGLIAASATRRAARA
jgi:hypothetical protein